MPVDDRPVISSLSVFAHACLMVCADIKQGKGSKTAGVVSSPYHKAIKLLSALLQPRWPVIYRHISLLAAAPGLRGSTSTMQGLSHTPYLPQTVSYE